VTDLPRQPIPTMVNAFDPNTIDELDDELGDTIRRRDKVLGPGYRLFYRRPLEVVASSGCHLTARDGSDYLDVYNNVPSVGHAHPRVVEAVNRQMGLLNTNTRYVHKPLVDYAERLVATFPAELTRATFTCTGSEANDLAFRIARYETGREGIIVTAGAYHGLTNTVASFSPSLGPQSPLGPNVRLIAAPDALRSPTDLTTTMKARVEQAISDLERHGYGLAALYADSIFSSDGVFADPPGFLAGMLDAVHAAGGLYVADEVQPGFGRTGENWWGFQRHGIVPDMVTIGKPMGNGLPIAGLVLREHVAQSFGRDVRYFNTFGGNSVSIAAAHAVLDVIEDEGLIAHTALIGRRLREGISAIVGESSRVAEVRGAGLFLGVDLVKDRESLEPDRELASTIVNELYDRRVLISASGPGGNVLKIRPPLVFDSADSDRFLDALADVAGSVLT
jgi:4-aminobutyrate aminotransferase-like enzyme